MPKVLLGAEELRSLSVIFSERIATDCLQFDRTGPTKSKAINGRDLAIFGPYPSLEADCRHSWLSGYHSCWSLAVVSILASTSNCATASLRWIRLFLWAAHEAGQRCCGTHHYSGHSGF